MGSRKEMNILGEFISENESIVILSGAGVSTASGIPDYRDQNGDWKHTKPMQFGEFKSSALARKRYWARSYVGWQRISRARPNVAHRALADLESSGKVEMLVTQNVDGLHSEAGSQSVIDLHGNLDKIRCVDCGATHARASYQETLRHSNPRWCADVYRYQPDGDAVLAEDSHHDFSVPGCPDCGGFVKPDVVMFGESVPKARVQRAFSAVDRAAALLVIGSSLMVYSGYRFALHASAQGMPLAIVNQGRTRADDIATLKVAQDCGAALSAAMRLVSV
jgi:NAD-dependent SIR2 family protein deacetylase